MVDRNITRDALVERLSRLRDQGWITSMRPLIQEGDVLIDFDARTGHNLGTKIRLRQNRVPSLYRHTETVLEGVRGSGAGRRDSPQRLL